MDIIFLLTVISNIFTYNDFSVKHGQRRTMTLCPWLHHHHHHQHSQHSPTLRRLIHLQQRPAGEPRSRVDFRIGSAGRDVGRGSAAKTCGENRGYNTDKKWLLYGLI